jgi:hypothetical protein
MLTIIHGEDTTSSRKYFIEQKEKHHNSPAFDGEKINLTDLAQIFDGGELFSDAKIVFIEQFFSKRKKSQERDGLVNSLQKYADKNDLFLWEGKELEKSILNSLKTANIKAFKLPQTLFLFIDGINPGNGKQLISLFHQTLQTTDAEMIFFMLVRQIRLLLALSNQSEESIDELKRLAPWQMGKIQSQAASFTSEQLTHLHNKLFQIEVAQKTGSLSSTLPSTIDFLLLEI